MEEEDQPLYLDVDLILTVHAAVFALSVDDARKRVLKAHELASVVHRPRTHAEYAGADLAHQAAVLAHGIAEGQLFVDGNKRTALEAMRLFLRLNDVDLDATQYELAEWILDLSRGGSVEDLAARISSHLVDR